MFPLAMSVVLVQAIIGIVDNPMGLVWWGALLVTLPIMTLFMRAMVLRDMARTSAQLPVVQGLALAGLALALIGSQNAADMDVALAEAIGGFVLLAIYIHWYSRLGRAKSEHLVVGNALPEFNLRDHEGVLVSSRNYHGAPALFVFHRGNWCPFCMGQIDELARRYQDLDELGVKASMISPQPMRKTSALSSRHNLDIDFMVDEGNAAARALGIEAKNALPMGLSLLGYATDTVLPTVIMTDAEGIILFADQTDNYRVRPEPDTFLRLFRERLAAQAP